MSLDTTDPVEWRLEHFQRLGFSDEQSIVLAYSKDFLGNYIYHEDVARMLERAKESFSDEDAHHIVFDILS